MRKHFKAKLERIQKKKISGFNYTQKQAANTANKYQSTDSYSKPSTISIAHPMPNSKPSVNLFDDKFASSIDQPAVKNNEKAWNELISAREAK